MIAMQVFFLLIILVVASFLTAASGEYLIGEDKTFTTIDILHVVGPKVCRRECSRRSNCTNTIYDKERLRCTLVSSGPSTIQIGDKSLKGHCASVDCTRNEVCVELPHRAKCVRRDLPRDCKDVLKLGQKRSGIYLIYPESWLDSIPVMCDMELEGGGFTMIQRRFDGSISFQRGWDFYVLGFGDLDSEFWIGNRYLALLTSNNSRMYIALEDHYGTKKYAEYNDFETTFEGPFRLKYNGYNGTAGNSLGNDIPFSSLDRDNDNYGQSCSKANGGSGGWWFDMCTDSQLNGKYCKKDEKGLHCNRWKSFKDDKRDSSSTLTMTTISMTSDNPTTTNYSESTNSYNTTEPPMDTRNGNQDHSGIIAGVLVPIVLLVICVVVLILLYRKEIWRPRFLTDIMDKITSNDNTFDTGWFGTRFGRRHSSKVPIQRNEVRQYATVEGDFENAFCRTIDEGHPEDSQQISYTLSEDSQYDELNKSHVRRVVDSSIAETYEHAHHLPPDLEKDYDSADASALFPKRFQFERPVSDSYNTYSHMPRNEQGIPDEDTNECNSLNNSENKTKHEVVYDNNVSHVVDVDKTDQNEEKYDTGVDEVILNKSLQDN